jgi:tetratricopeptide (TPR) repeat protein
MQCWLAATLLVALWAGVAQAAPADVETARRLDASARVHFNLGEYEAALRDFREAYRLEPRVELLFNVAQCQRWLQQFAEAARSYRAFLHESADAPAMIGRDEVQRLIAEMERRGSQQSSVVTLASARPAAPTSGQAVEPAPHPATPPSALMPGPATETTSAALDRPGAAASDAEPAPTRAWYRRPTPLALSIGGVLTVGVAGALLGLAARDGSDAAHATRLTSFERLHASDLALQRAGWPLLGVGAASLTAAAVVIVLQWKGAL